MIDISNLILNNIRRKLDDIFEKYLFKSNDESTRQMIRCDIDNFYNEYLYDHVGEKFFVDNDEHVVGHEEFKFDLDYDLQSAIMTIKPMNKYTAGIMELMKEDEED